MNSECNKTDKQEPDTGASPCPDQNFGSFTSDDKTLIRVASNDNPAVGQGHYMTLLYDARSSNAHAFTEALTLEVHRVLGRKNKPTAKLQRAVGAILAELIRAAADGPGGYAYRSVGSDTFADTPIGQKAFKEAFRALEGLGFATSIRGYKEFGKAGIMASASRFACTDKLLERAFKSGIEPSGWNLHFRMAPPPAETKQPVVLKASSTKVFGSYGAKVPGATMLVDQAHPMVQRSSEQIRDINAFVSRQTLSNCPHYQFRRVFNQGDLPRYDYNKGGRIISAGDSYQNMSKERRSLIEVNGEPTVEIDIRCSQPTILAAKLGQPLAKGFYPYTSSVFPKTIMKSYIMQTLGSNAPATVWDETLKAKYADEHYDSKDASLLQRDFPISRVKAEALKRWPLLAEWKNCQYRWGDLQFIESEVIIHTVHRLAIQYGVLALPVHDSIIIPASQADRAERVLSAAFGNFVGAPPELKRK